MSPAGLPWSDPNSDPLADVMAYIRACEEAYARDLYSPCRCEACRDDRRGEA